MSLLEAAVPGWGVLVSVHVPHETGSRATTLENHIGSSSFYFSLFALFLLGSTRARFGTGEARGAAFPLLSWVMRGDD
jgi:hypothetical protein